MDFTGVEQQLLFFNETVMSHDIEVLINNDGIAELNEHFLAVSSLLDPQLPPSKILISPAVANVTIVDGESTNFNISNAIKFACFMLLAPNAPGLAVNGSAKYIYYNYWYLGLITLEINLEFSCARFSS